MSTGTVLVLAAHPDDEVIGCGATLCQWQESGRKIFVAYAGQGRVGGQQATEAREVCRKAGWDLLHLGTAPDNQFDQAPLQEFVGWMEQMLKLARPDTVLCHDAHDTNQDHQVLARAAAIACRPFTAAWRPARGSTRERWSFPVAGSTVGFKPSTYIDIAQQWERKAELLRLYGSELRDFPHPRSVDALEAQAKVLGSRVGFRMAEGFRLQCLSIGAS